MVTPIDLDELRDALHFEWAEPLTNRKFVKIMGAAKAYISLQETGMVLPELPSQWIYESFEYFPAGQQNAWACLIWLEAKAFNQLGYGPTPLAAAQQAIAKINTGGQQ